MSWACDLRSRLSESYSASSPISLPSRSNSHFPRNSHFGFYGPLQLFTCPRLGVVVLSQSDDAPDPPWPIVRQLNLEDRYMDNYQQGDTVDGIVHATLQKPLVGSIHPPEPWWASLRVTSVELSAARDRYPYPWPFALDFLRSCRTIRTFKIIVIVRARDSLPDPNMGDISPAGRFHLLQLADACCRARFSTSAHPALDFRFPITS